MIKSDWKSEDLEFMPKRKVSNRGSRNRVHIIGTFYSNKMKKEVEYESLNEFIFYAFLELDFKVMRYYVQPLEIDIPFIDEDGDRGTWVHVTDVLVFRQGDLPTIYQIKDTGSIVSEKTKLINKTCYKYASLRGWEYKVVYPKKLPKDTISNINFLFGFLKKRKNYDVWIPQLIEKLTCLRSVSIIDLALSFSREINPIHILPIIYHLIAVGVFYVELSLRISEYSEIGIQNEQNYNKFLNLYEGI